MTMTQIISRKTTIIGTDYSFLQARPDPSRYEERQRILLPELETSSFKVWIMIGKTMNYRSHHSIEEKKEVNAIRQNRKRSPEQIPPNTRYRPSHAKFKSIQKREKEATGKEEQRKTY